MSSTAVAAAAKSGVGKAAALLTTRGLPALHRTSVNPYAPVAKWILGTSGLVATMVHVGGVTRLTKSGLSMTDWKPLGSLPPMNEDEWSREFDRYKTFPEFEQRRGMTLDEFRYIYYWEWGHRMLGRVVGVCFAVPWGYFTLRGKIPPGYHQRMALLFGMGGTQGLVGWWMVKSGLGEDRRGDRNEIRVSPYRLAAHLGMAVSTYAVLVWTGLGILQYPTDASAVVGGKTRLQELTSSLSSSAMRHARRLRGGAMGATALTGLTVLSGAFVAGNDAGNAYNTFPFMNDRLVPLDDMVNPELQPLYRNAFENTAMVQWDHRVLGTITAVSALGLAGAGLFHPAVRAGGAAAAAITPQVRRGLAVFGGVAVGQMSLGVATLLNYVPIGLAAAHQLGSLIVLTSGIYVVHSLRYASPAVARSLSKFAAGAATKAAPAGASPRAAAGMVMKVAK